jgi:hypothetical protein
MLPRTDWDDLPASVRTAVQARTGPVASAGTVPAGMNSAMAVVLRTSDGHVFVKGLRHDHPGVITQQREAAVNPYLRGIAPRLLWRIDAGGWNLLGFEHLAGRHADYAPGLADLPLVIDAMRRLSEIPCPPVPHVKCAEQRWAAYADNQADLASFCGLSLLHTDFNPCNVLITGGGARIIDWAWPTRGAAWIDPASLVLRLMAAGHSPAQAETWASALPAWITVPARAVTAFARSGSRLWDQIACDDPQPWKLQMAANAREWARYRSW